MEITYIGSKSGMEQELLADLSEPIKFVSVATGKLRRYISLKNLSDIFKITYGLLQSLIILRKIKPVFVFNKGGYVGVPVSYAAWFLKIPVIVHESDSSMGLANKLVSKIADKVVVSHPVLQKHFSHKKSVLKFPLPIRFALTQGERQRALTFLKLTDRPTLLVMGGSQGSNFVNELLLDALPELLKTHNVVHIFGKGKSFESTEKLEDQGYRGFAYVKEELPDLYMLADVLLSRAGATVLAEWSIFNKPAILIPLAKNKSRGEQITNAEFYLHDYEGVMLTEKQATTQAVVNHVKQLSENDFSNDDDTVLKKNLIEKQQKITDKYLKLFESYLI